MLMVMAAVVVMALVVVHDSELLSLLLFSLFFPCFFVDMGFSQCMITKGRLFKHFFHTFFVLTVI